MKNQSYLAVHPLTETRPASRRAIATRKRRELIADVVLCIVVGVALALALVQWWVS